MASVPYIVKEEAVVKVEVVVKEEVAMAALVEELVIENGVLAQANEAIALENRQLRLIIFQLKKKRSVKRPKCRFC